LDNGTLQKHDIRTHSDSKVKPVWTLQAHDTEISSFDVSTAHPGLIVTGSVDKLVKLWQIPPRQLGPSLVLSRDLDLGRVFSTQFAPDKDVGMKVAVAGSTGSVKIWDLSTSSAARKAFGLSGRAKETVEEGKVVGLTEVSDDEDEDAEEGEGGEDGWEDMDDN
jgi:periodic tryptophan protein 1